MDYYFHVEFFNIKRFETDFDIKKKHSKTVAFPL